MPEPSFGVILLNWNGLQDTEAALNSILAASPRPDYVVVVDNGSHDHSLQKLQGWADTQSVTAATVAADEVFGVAAAPWLVLIDAKTNRGFAEGNNLGLQYLATHTNATHFLLLNNDTEIAPDYFEQLSRALQMEPEAGLLGSAIYYFHDRTKVWYAGGYEIPYRALVLHAHTVPTDPAPRSTTFVTGCAMLIARPVYERLGGLDACYTPVYWEDTDYSRRAVDAGFAVFWAPRAQVYHKIGASVGDARVTPKVAYWQNRHRGYYVRRNYHGFDRLAALTYLCATKPGRSLVELLRGNPAMGSAILRGFAHGVFGQIP